jgi:hypothetical protein
MAAFLVPFLVLFLFGVTGDATVQLTDDNKRSGTFWKVKKVE